MALRGFYEEAQKVRSWAYQNQEKIHSERTQEIVDNVAFKNLEGHIYELIEEGYGPDEFPRQVRAAYKELGREGTLGMGYGKLDDYVTQIATNIASEHPELALSLINTKPEGVEGPAAQPLRNKLRYRDRVASIEQAATRAIGERELEQGVRETNWRNWMRILDDGDYSRFEDREVVSDTTGATKTITAQEQEEWFVRSLRDHSQRLQDEEHLSQSAADREMHNVLMKLGIESPWVKDEIDGIEQRFDIGTQQDPGHMSDIVERVDRWRDMSNTSRTYTNSQLSEDTREFLGTVDTLIRLRGMDTETAVQVAQRVVDPDDRGMRTSFTAHRADVEAQVRSQWSYWFAGWRDGVPDARNDEFNTGAVVARVETYARRLYATGEFSVDRAIEIAAEEVANITPHYQGQVLFGLEGFPRHENWNDGLDAVMENFEGIVGPWHEGPITVRHEGGGRLTVTDLDGVPLRGGDGQILATNVMEVNSMAEQVREGRAREATREAIERQRRHQEIIDQGGQEGPLEGTTPDDPDGPWRRGRDQ